MSVVSSSAPVLRGWSRPLALERLVQGRWRQLAYAYALLIALLIGYFLFRTPLQLSDSLGNMLQIQSESLWSVVEQQFTAKAYLRPFLWGMLKVFFDLANGNYFFTFKLVHSIQIALVLLLSVRLFRINSALDLALVPLGMAVLIGMHTFAPVVREAYPIPTFLTVVVCCLVAANLATSRGGWWADVGVIVAFCFAVFIVETGLLVWGITVAAFLVGFRGVSRRGVIGVTLALAGYFFLRFGPLGVGSPGLIERSAGFGFRVREPSELMQMFGTTPIGFYVYNVVSSFISVFFAEPRAGIWELMGAIVLRQTVQPYMVVNVLSSALTTVVIAAYLVARFSHLIRWRLDYEDRVVLVSLAAIAGNAVISYPYTKDLIMAPAGVFYAVAALIAIRALLRVTMLPQFPKAALRVVAALLLVVSVGWSMRGLGLAYTLRTTAWTNRNDWATADTWLASQGITPKTAEGLQLVQTLRTEMIHMDVTNPRDAQPAVQHWVDGH